MTRSITFLLILSLWCLSSMGFAFQQCDLNPIELSGDGQTEGDAFGFTVALSENTLVVGAHDDNEAGSDAGAAYVYRRAGNQWVFEQKLMAADAGPNHSFGHSVAIEEDVLVIGAPLDSTHAVFAGSAYVFRHDGGQWVQEAKLQKNIPGTFDLFGQSVDIEDQRVVVGAPSDSSKSLEAGAAYSFVSSGGTWSLESHFFSPDSSTGDDFGFSVSLSAGRLAIGAPCHDGSSDDEGAVYVFDVGGTLEEKVGWSGVDARDRWGIDVVLQGTRLVVGMASWDGENSILVFEWDVQWSETSVLVDSTVPGLGVSLDLKGDRLLAGSTMRETARLYQRLAGSWVPDGVLDPPGNEDEEFGVSVALSDGHALVGAPLNLVGSRVLGQATVYDVSQAATSSLYGEGWPGTFGIPGLGVSEDPVLGTTFELVVDNSQILAPTTGFLIGGFDPLDAETDLGGTLLVDPFVVIPIRIPAFRANIPVDLPSDPALEGTRAYVQALQIDPIASHGYAFTPGRALKFEFCAR